MEKIRNGALLKTKTPFVLYYPEFYPFTNINGEETINNFRNPGLPVGSYILFLEIKSVPTHFKNSWEIVGNSSNIVGDKINSWTVVEFLYQERVWYVIANHNSREGFLQENFEIIQNGAE